MSTKTMKTTTANIWLDQNEILHCCFIQNRFVSIQDLRAMVKTRIALCEDEKKHPLIVDLRRIQLLNAECLRYLASKDGLKYVSKIAILVNNRVNRLTGSLLKNIYIPQGANIPISIFFNHKSAMSWVLPSAMIKVSA